ncbi:MAG: type II toxin-antitoxin system RelB/DinJ family antitoxin, partial [Bacteroidales bacterium]|nr:type II toxin-antitoxin system RelB/DinJ family antitoxin [Bacteroidales bacterium]
EAKRVFEQTCANLGLSVSAALSIYVHKVINEKEIPFKISKVDYEKMQAKALHDLKI